MNRGGTSIAQKILDDENFAEYMSNYKEHAATIKTEIDNAIETRHDYRQKKIAEAEAAASAQKVAALENQLATQNQQMARMFAEMQKMNAATLAQRNAQAVAEQTEKMAIKDGDDKSQEN